jgi:hypothetical protein
MPAKSNQAHIRERIVLQALADNAILEARRLEDELETKVRAFNRRVDRLEAQLSEAERERDEWKAKYWSQNPLQG